MNYKIDRVYISVIALCLWLGLALAYQTAHAGIISWITGGSKVVEEVKDLRTIDSEVDRLSTKYLVDKKIIHAIIDCESSMYGNAVNHNKLDDGTIWSSDFGPLQINDYFHEETMTRLGLDIHNQFDSLEYGFMLYKDQGVGPWSASSKCWKQKI